MKKTYKIEVDCAVCAQKAEDCLKQIAGVEDASINFLTQKLKLTADPEKLDDILAEAKKRLAQVDDDIVLYA